MATRAPGCPFTLLKSMAGPMRVGRATVPPRRYAVCAAEFRHGIGFDVCLGELAVLVQQFEGGAQICNIGGR